MNSADSKTYLGTLGNRIGFGAGLLEAEESLY
jgi:hypothetical protein